MDNMQQGILWFDPNLKANLQVVAGHAADYVHDKYGCKPSLCFVHPDMLERKIKLKNGLEIRPSQYILPNHLWLEIKS